MKIEWNQVIFSYENRPILLNSSFAIDQNTFVGIMGPNGGGKTTLLKLLIGFLKPLSGEISIFGKNPSAYYPNISYVPQFFRCDRDFPISTEEIIHMGIGFDPSQKEKVEFWMNRLQLWPHRKKKFGELSGGLAQRALLARALISDPKLLFLDEPTANIDPPSSIAILDLLQEFRGKKTIFLVTHDIKTIVEQVDQILCVQGKIQSYFPGEICEHFAMGLYHTPLLDLPTKHWKK